MTGKTGNVRKMNPNAAAIIVVLYFLCGQAIGAPLPTVLIAKDPYDEYVAGPYRRSGVEPTILRVQSFLFTNLDENASKKMTKVMTRINGHDVVGWGCNVDEATSDAYSNAEKANDERLQYNIGSG